MTHCETLSHPVDTLARQFSQLVRRDLGPWLTEINKRNNSYSSACCATHDFCDTNVIMLEAFRRAFGRPLLVASDKRQAANIDVANAAWRLARATEFKLI